MNLEAFAKIIVSVFIAESALSTKSSYVEKLKIVLLSFLLLAALNALPIVKTTSILVFNIFSRKFEFQADRYASETFNSESLIEALKILSKDSLSNLTPHPSYVWWHYSHPPLSKRISHLQ